MYDSEYNRRLKLEVKRQLYKQNTTESGDFTGPFDCRFCGKIDKAYCHTKSPRRSFCNNASCSAHKDNGGESMVKLLDFHYDFEKEHKKRGSSNDIIWQEYLKSRGLDKTIEGLNAEHRSNVRNTGRGGVFVSLTPNIDGKVVKSGRIYNPIDNNKNHTTGKVTGSIFKHPAREHNYDEPVYVVEGWITCNSVEEIGLQSLSIISTNQNPKAVEHHIKPYNKIVLSFDNDKRSTAGIDCTRKYLPLFPDAEVLMLDKGEDYNDLLCRAGSAKKARKIFDANRERYRNNAKIELSETPWERGRLRYELFGKLGIFTDNGATYHSVIRTKGQDKPTAKTELIGRFCLDTIAFITSQDGPNNEYKYKLKITPTKAPPKIVVASPRDISKHQEFNNFLVKTCKCNFKGGSQAMNDLLDIITTSDAKETRQCLDMGLDKTSGWWVCRDWAVTDTGVFKTPDSDGLFKRSSNQYLMPAENANSQNVITPSLQPQATLVQIYELIRKAWPDLGTIGFTWYVGALFVNELKEKYGWFPMLSIAGPASTGKTCFVEYLQNLQGWDLEGRDLSNSSSDVGMSRELYGKAGGFNAILEMTHETEHKIAKFLNILGCFNRGGGNVKGQKTNDNSVKENHLRTGLLFCSNAETWKNKQEKSRFISLIFTDDYKNADTLASYKNLLKITKEDRAAVTIEILKHRQDILTALDTEYPIAQGDMGEIPPGRVADTHALLLAISRVINKIFKIDDDLFHEIEKLAIKKDEDCRKSTISDLSIFFEKIQSCKKEEIKKFWVEITDRKKPNYGCTYIAMSEIYYLLADSGERLPDQVKVQSLLREHPAYLNHGQNYNFPIGQDAHGKKQFLRRKAWKINTEKLCEAENITFDFAVIHETKF